MSALQLVKKQCRPLCRFLGLKLYCLAPSSKIFAQHISRAKGLNIRNDEYKCTPFGYCLSRSYLTQTSLSTLSTLDTLDIQEIESSECKQIILHLLASFFNLEAKDLLNKDTLLILFEKYKEWGACNRMSSLKTFQKLVSESKGFQKFLEMLPSHLDSMRLDELLDVFGGLLLLGIPETNPVITYVINKFQHVGLGAREIAKLSAIFDGGYFNFNSRHIVQYTLLAPALKSLLADYMLYDKNDLVYLSNLMSQSWIKTYPEVMDTYTIIISAALDHSDVHGEHLNVDCLLAILTGVCECIRRGMVLRQPFNLRLIELSSKILDLLKPHMPQLTPEQSYLMFTTLSSIYSTKARELITQSHRSVFDDFEKMQIKNTGVNKQKKVLKKPNLPKKNNFTQFSYFDFTNSDRVDLLDIIPHVDEIALFDLVQKEACINPDDKTTFGLVMRNRLVKLMEEKFSNAELIEFQKHPYYPYLEIMEILQTWKKNDRSHMSILWGCQNFLKSWLLSGYACDNGTFRRICHVAIGFMGFAMPMSTVKRIENLILSMNMSQLEYADSFLSGISSPYASKGIFMTRNKKHRTLQKKLSRLLENAFIRRMKDMENCGVELLDVSLEEFGGNLQNFVRFRRCLGKALERLENAEEYFLSSLDRNENHRYLTEDMANRILKLFAGDFNTKFAAYQRIHVLLLLLQSFYQLSRLPQHLEELEQLAKHVLDTEFNSDCSYNIITYYQLLYLLSNMEIYFDEHIQRAFMEENIKEFIRAVTTGSKVNEMWNIGCFILLNRHMCIHRPEIGIPWQRDPFFGLKKTSTGNFRMDLELGLARRDLPGLNNEFVRQFFNGANFIYKSTNNFIINIKYQYFLDSNNKPVTLSMKDNLYVSALDSLKDFRYKSCVIEHSNWTVFDCLTNDENAIALQDARRIQDLEALGHEVIFIPAHEWLGVFTESDSDLRRYDVYNYLREKCKIKLTL